MFHPSHMEVDGGGLNMWGLPPCEREDIYIKCMSSKYHYDTIEMGIGRECEKLAVTHLEQNESKIHKFCAKKQKGEVFTLFEFFIYAWVP